MKLWLLRPRDSNSGPWDPWYDKAFGFVVRSETERAARTYADEGGGCETRYGEKQVWSDERLSTCEELASDGPEGIVLRDFKSV